MPPVSKKDISVIAFDLDQSNKSFYEEALSFLLDITSREWFFSPKNETKLIFLNCETTNNISRVANVYEPHESFLRYNPKTLKDFITDARYVSKTTNWLEGIVVGLEILNNELEDSRGIYGVQLLVVTKSLFGKDQDETLLERVTDLQEKHNIKTIIAGPCIATKFISNELELDEKRREFSVTDDTCSVETKRLLTRLCNETETIVCDLNMARNFFASFRTKMELQPWSEPLKIGSELKIPTLLLRILKEEGAVSVKDKTEAGSTRSCYNYTWVGVDDEEKQFFQQDIIGGVLRWGKFVAFTEDVVKGFKTKGPRFFSLLGFTSKENIPEYLFQTGTSGTYVLVPNTKEENSERFVYLLYKVLVETKKYAVASKTYAANHDPKLVVLIPDPKHEMILVNELPYAEDIIHPYKESEISLDANVKLDPEEKDVLEFIKGYNKSAENAKETGALLGPSLCYNLRSGQIARKLADIYMDEQTNIQKSNITSYFAKDRVFDFELNFPEREDKKEEKKEQAEEMKDEPMFVDEVEDFLL